MFSLMCNLGYAFRKYLYDWGRENTGSFVAKNKTITWDPTMGVITEKGIILSLTSVLNHEVDHALQHDKNPEQHAKDSKTKVKNYNTAEEKWVIMGSEQETADKLGEKGLSEVTRTNHKGQAYETKGPTTTIGIYRI